MEFDDAFKYLLGHEGGYVNDPSDPGKETKFGISKRAYPGEDIPNITLERAKFLYQRDYWAPAGCQVAPKELKFHLFDFAVNSGPKTAVKQLQSIVGEVQDGVYGPRTMMAVNNYYAQELAILLSTKRLQYMTTLSNWSDHGKGWARRIAANIEIALRSE